MEIISLGHSSFRIKAKNAAVITDPFDAAMTGLKFPKNQTADIVTISHQHADHNQSALVTETKLVIAGPGEYEANGIRISGYPTFHDAEEGKVRGKNTLYKIYLDSINVVHCGDLGHLLSEELVEEIDCDILLVPTGGVFTLDEKQAVKLIRQLEPSIVVPMHYRRDGLSADFSGLSTVDDFLREVGKPAEKMSKLVVKKDSLPEEMKVVVLE